MSTWILTSLLGMINGMKITEWDENCKASSEVGRNGTIFFKFHVKI